MTGSLATRECTTVNNVSGPLLFVERVKGVSYGEIVDIDLPNGERRTGQVLDVSDRVTVIQVFEGTIWIDNLKTRVRFSGKPFRIDVSRDMLGRVFNGVGRPRDGGPEIVPEASLDIAGMAINPFARDKPAEFIQTGMSAIDGLNTLVRGQKLPIFTGSGLPANKLAAQIARQAKVIGEGEKFAVVFCAMGITYKEASFFMRDFERTGALERVVFFMNLADDPTIERVATPRCALAAAEFLAFTHDLHVLVILTDMINYCEALREISTAREEVPGRRGYPGYMYTDLATIYERAGRIRGRNPPIDALPCLSRLMNLGIGPGKTREDHRNVADQLYASYAYGRDLRRLVAIVGEEALTDLDREYLKFADAFEQQFVSQGNEDRSFDRTISIAWDLLAMLPEAELKRVKVDFIRKYHPAYRQARAPGREGA
ncbi:MAG: V-type ATP synthase beta chain [Methanocella sp. PtaU1.Bin125]|nr:MAG: V-type ATP synthase beta chain [Methanocella sp. PtaU1.Bin125]